MVEDCLMTEDCPGYDHDRRVCLIRPGDCEFSAVDREGILMAETPEAREAPRGTLFHEPQIGG